MGSSMKGSLGVGGCLGGFLSSCLRGVGTGGGVWQVWPGGVDNGHGEAGLDTVGMKPG